MIRKIKAAFQFFDRRRRFFRQIPSNAVVLELGCGSGENCSLVRSMAPGTRILGVDIIQDPGLPDWVEFAPVDLNVHPLPFEDEFFDVIIFTHVIEHLHSTSLAGSEIHRVLKSGGKIYVETPNWTSTLVPSFGFRREQHSPFNFFDDPTHVRPWSKQGIFEFLVQMCDLDVETVGTVRNWPRLLIDPFIILGAILMRNRQLLISSVWNLTGWSIYGVGRRR